MGKPSRTGKPGIAADNNSGALGVPETVALSALDVPRRRGAETVRNAEVRDDSDRIFLNAGAIDTTARVERKPVGQFAGKRLHLVRFAGPIKPAWHKALQDAGGEVVTYIPSDAYLVHGDMKSLARLQAWAATEPAVQWEGTSRPEHKLLRPSPAGLYAVELIADPRANHRILRFINRLKPNRSSSNTTSCDTSMSSSPCAPPALRASPRERMSCPSSRLASRAKSASARLRSSPARPTRWNEPPP